MGKQKKILTFTTEKNLNTINTRPRSSAKFILFTILTGGIYSLFLHIGLFGI